MTEDGTAPPTVPGDTGGPGGVTEGRSDVVLQPELLVVDLALGTQVVKLVQRWGDPAVGVEQGLAHLRGETFFGMGNTHNGRSHLPVTSVPRG